MNSSHVLASPMVCLVGAGNMGGAMLGGWLAAGNERDSITVIDPDPPEPIARMIADHGLRHFTSVEQAGEQDIVIVAVKPQMMDAVLPQLVPLMGRENALLSVAAGTTIAQLSAPFGSFQGDPVRVIRAMPNTPAQIGRGITVCVSSASVSDAQKVMVSDLLSSIGQVEWIDDEALMDAVTGVSGSGPAYVFYMAEALASAGVKAGLPVPLATFLAQATVSGAGELLRQSDLSAAQLRKNVTSPNGTTAAALEVLMDEAGLAALMEQAVAAATERSRELAGS